MKNLLTKIIAIIIAIFTSIVVLEAVAKMYFASIKVAVVMTVTWAIGIIILVAIAIYLVNRYWSNVVNFFRNLFSKLMNLLKSLLKAFMSLFNFNIPQPPSMMAAPVVVYSSVPVHEFEQELVDITSTIKSVTEHLNRCNVPVVESSIIETPAYLVEASARAFDKSIFEIISSKIKAFDNAVSLMFDCSTFAATCA